MRRIDFSRHNAETREVWDSYRRGEPRRVPVFFGTNIRFTMPLVDANPRRIGFERYIDDPQIMLERQIEHMHWIGHHIPQDREMGLPSEGWDICVDFQNTYEAAWFGCPVFLEDGQVPDTRPILGSDETRDLLFERGTPDLFEGGCMRRNWEYYACFKRKKEEGFTRHGLPIRNIHPTGLGTDGPLTVACNLRGATEFMTDLVADPDYALKLLDFITNATIQRIRAYRERLNLPLKSKEWGFADDSVQLISTSMYREMIQPFHRRLIDALSDNAALSMHLCGDSTRHFTMLRDELNIQSFDTGFPVDFGKLRRELGPRVQIQGGPDIAFLLRASPQEVGAEVRRILESGVTEGKRFILREGNNLPPGVSLENLWAMYDAAREYGRYS